MARLARIAVVNMAHHVTQRGNARESSLRQRAGFVSEFPNDPLVVRDPWRNFTWTSSNKHEPDPWPHFMN
jgi:hypothetical protein